MDLKSAVMGTLSERLSITLSELSRRLDTPQDEVEKALVDLQGEDLVNLAKDSIMEDVLVSPTTRGILQARRQSKSTM